MANLGSTFRIGGRRVLACVLAAFFSLGAQAGPGGAATSDSSPPPLVLGVAIDEAGIGESDLRRSEELVLSLRRALPEGALVALGSFTGDKRILLPATGVEQPLAEALSTLRAGTPGVALPDGLFDLIQYLSTVEASSRALLFISTGQVRDGALHFEDPLAAAGVKEIRISCIATGPGDGRLLRRIAKLTGGEYFRLEVAEPAMIVRGLVPEALPSPPGPPQPDPRPAEAPPEARPATGLLGAAAVFFSLGGLLMLALALLLVRRLGTPTKERAASVPAPSPAVSAPSPAPAPERGRPPTPEDFQEAEAETLLERTLAVNADPTLRALSGPGAGKNFPLSPGGETTIGRSRRNHIVVPEDAASAHHCRIDREGDSYVVHDLGSTNGLWLNGARIERAVLQHGDRLKVGDTVFTVSLFGDRS